MRKITLLMLIAFTTITAHGQNKLLSSIQEYYDGSSWVNSQGYNYEYDSNNNLIAETDLEWNSTSGVWKTIYKTTYTYNASNKVTQIYQQNRNGLTNQLENSEKYIYTYTNGKITEIAGYNWNNSNWVNDYKTQITYNSNNLPEIGLDYSWDGTQWVLERRITITYNSINKIISRVDEGWANSKWVNDSKSLYTYNSNNKLITERGAKWDEFNNIWVEAGAYRADYELDATGNRISRTESGSYDYKEEYTYDGSALMSSFIHPFKDKTGVDYLFEDFPYVNKLLTTTGFSFNAITNSYTNNSRTTYNYNSAITLSTETLEIEDNSITFYPNPTQDLLFIKTASNTSIDKITVTDLTGKKVIEQKQNTAQVNVQNLAKGIYILEVFVGQNKQTRKFIKE